jgi:hypothetical protein
LTNPVSDMTTLSPLETTLAGLIAKTRNARSTSAGNLPAHGAPPNGTSADTLMPNIIGATGEVGVAKLLGLYPNTSVYHEEKATGGYDLDHRVSVRSARKRFGLLVRPSDPPDGRYVATVVNGNAVLVLGWEYGERAKRDEWLSTPHGRPPCFLVPERHLQPLASLRKLIAQERVAYDDDEGWDQW